MSLDSISPRAAVVVGALALLPVAWYGLAGSGTAGLFSAINVLIILAALLIAMGPIADSSSHGESSA